jgi:hypothetical protein
MHVPKWFIDLHYEGCPDATIQVAYESYQAHREEGYSKDYILVCVLGLADPEY